MENLLFTIDPTRLAIAAACGIVLLLLLIIKWKIHPILSLLVSSLLVGLGAGMPVTALMTTVEEGAANTLQGLVLLIGLGSMFGGILEVSGGAQAVAQALVNRFGEKKAGIALGFTGLIVGTTVFFEAGVMILMPLAFSLAKSSKKSVLFYAVPLMAGLAGAFAFVPPSAGSVMVANLMGVDLGLMILVGVPTGIISLLTAGVIWGNWIGKRMDIQPPAALEPPVTNVSLPSCKMVLSIILTPLVLILCSTLSTYVPALAPIQPVLLFLGTPFVALLVAVFLAIFLLGRHNHYTPEDVKTILDASLKPTAGVLLVITGGGVLSAVLQACGMGELVSSALESTGLPLVLVAFVIAGFIRICIGAAPIPMAMTAGIMMGMPAVADLSPLYLAAIVLAINGGSSAFSHVNDAGFWMVTTFLGIKEKQTLKTWTIMGTIMGFTGLACAMVITLFA